MFSLTSPRHISTLPETFNGRADLTCSDAKDLGRAESWLLARYRLAPIFRVSQIRK
jgi:hypothetical protein